MGAVYKHGALVGTFSGKQELESLLCSGGDIIILADDWLSVTEAGEFTVVHS